MMDRFKHRNNYRMVCKGAVTHIEDISYHGVDWSSIWSNKLQGKVQAWNLEFAANRQSTWTSHPCNWSNWVIVHENTISPTIRTVGVNIRKIWVKCCGSKSTTLCTVNHCTYSVGSGRLWSIYRGASEQMMEGDAAFTVCEENPTKLNKVVRREKVSQFKTPLLTAAQAISLARYSNITRSKATRKVE